MTPDYYRKGTVTSNTYIFWLVYVSAGLFLVFAGVSLLFYLQDPYCAIGPDTVKECWAVSFEKMKEYPKHLLEGF